MIFFNIFLFSCYVSFGFGQWVAEWLTPVEEQLFSDNNPSRRTNDEVDLRLFGGEGLGSQPLVLDYEELVEDRTEPSQNNEAVMLTLRTKLEDTLQSAKSLAESLRNQIESVTQRERLLKEAIVNGRSGVTTVTVTSLGGRLPRTYIVRDGTWSLCHGYLQYPALPARRTFATNKPRCVGQEVRTARDRCVFNSIIKYETLPQYRRLEYSEDDYLCLKNTFNNTVEQYMSVPKGIINETCTRGLVRSLVDNEIECGIRIMVDYTYFPQTISDLHLPLEYCNAKDGSCKLITAWHVSNVTIENFEFLKNDANFKKFFIKSGSYLGQTA